MNKISIAFVDDHPILLDGIVGIFSADSSFDVVAKGNSSADAIEISKQLKPQVLVTDLSMPGDAYDAMACIRRHSPDTKIVALTAAAGIDAAVKALESGATAYVLKGSTMNELRGAIQMVLNGETYITQGFATKIISALRAATARSGAACDKLSAREDQIVNLLLRGKTNKEIAEGLKISKNTVKHYMTALMQKLQVRNRLEVVLAAQKRSRQAQGKTL